MSVLRWLLLVLALGGVYVSAKALHIHNSTDIPACSINEKWDCGVVNHSEFAVIQGVPVACFGIVGYGLLALLAIANQRPALFLLTLPALGFALRLTYIEKFVLEVWCLFCVISQCIILLMAVTSLAWWLLGRHKGTPVAA